MMNKLRYKTSLSSGTKSHIAWPERRAHPIDVIERIADSHGWSFERIMQDEIATTVTGSIVDYRLSLSWLEEHETLHLSCAFSLQTPVMRMAELARLLARINERLLFGHFDYWRQSGEIMYRQTLLLSGGLHPTDAQIKTLLATALDACEAHYYACRSVVLLKISADEALRHTLFETLGNA